MNLKQILVSVGTVIVSVVLSVIVVGNQPQDFGATGTRFPNGISADTTSPVAGELRGDDLTLDDDAVINGRSLTVTSTNTSTSTTAVGCIQTTATSTATPIHFEIGSSGATTTHTTATGKGVGVVQWAYGACPI